MATSIDPLAFNEESASKEKDGIADYWQSQDGIPVTAAPVSIGDASEKPNIPVQEDDKVPNDESLHVTPADAVEKKPSTIVKALFAEPLKESVAPSPPQLTAEQQSKYDAVLETVTTWTTIPDTSNRNSTNSPITDDERMWLTRDCILRYLRATKWSISETPKRLQDTLTWRREYNMESLTPEYISPENETGKLVILGYDVAARPCLYMNVSKQNTPKSNRQIQELVFILERTVDLMWPNQEMLTLLINFKNTSNGSVPSLSQGRETLNILQSHYPERLGRALIINVPWFVGTFFKLITPFIDPLTREKLVFNDDLRKHVPPAQLTDEYGGDVKFEYDHSIYWPSLNKLTEQRRRDYKKRWVRGGKQIGEIEAYLKGGNEKSLNGTTA